MHDAIVLSNARAEVCICAEVAAGEKDDVYTVRQKREGDRDA